VWLIGLQILANSLDSILEKRLYRKKWRNQEWCVSSVERISERRSSWIKDFFPINFATPRFRGSRSAWVRSFEVTTTIEMDLCSGFFLQFFNEFKVIHFRHHQVDENNSRRFLLDSFKRFFPICCFLFYFD